jgi:hypothetical protein
MTNLAEDFSPNLAGGRHLNVSSFAVSLFKEKFCHPFPDLLED